MVVIEMNPRVSRSSALASKATGFPIAKIAAKLAVGYTLDEIPNDITRSTPSCFEPTWTTSWSRSRAGRSRSSPTASPVLGTQMKSVGEAMAIGRTFKEALQKAVRSLEIGRIGLGADGNGRAWTIAAARAADHADCGAAVLHPLRVAVRDVGRGRGGADRRRSVVPGPDRGDRGARRPPALVRPGLAAFRRPAAQGEARRVLGPASGRTAGLHGRGGPCTAEVPEGSKPVYKRVDTCAAEFAAETPYMYSTYEEEDESEPTDRRKVMILGGGPNRIGQGIEFDYCCCHASFALREEGIESIMVNCNPETVSTDYDTSDRLYFEPLTLEDVLRIVEVEQPEGVIVQFGGQTPLSLALAAAGGQGVPILGTSPDSIDLAEDRHRFGALLERTGDPGARSGGRPARWTEAREVAERIGYPVLVRPSYVLGGRAMFITHDESDAGRDHAQRRRRPRRTIRCCWTSSWRMPSRWTWTRSATASAW